MLKQHQRAHNYKEYGSLLFLPTNFSLNLKFTRAMQWCNSLPEEPSPGLKEPQGDSGQTGGPSNITSTSNLLSGAGQQSHLKVTPKIGSTCNLVCG